MFVAAWLLLHSWVCVFSLSSLAESCSSLEVWQSDSVLPPKLVTGCNVAVNLVPFICHIAHSCPSFPSPLLFSSHSLFLSLSQSPLLSPPLLLTPFLFSSLSLSPLFSFLSLFLSSLSPGPLLIILGTQTHILRKTRPCRDALLVLLMTRPTDLQMTISTRVLGMIYGLQVILALRLQVFQPSIQLQCPV